MYTPYDWQQTIAHRAQYVEGRLLGGSPVVGLSCDGGVLLATVRNSARKVFEIYDRLIYAGVGSQADLETLRVAAIDFAHSEGFTRSEDDVTIQRVVSSALSPALKKAFSDPSGAPFIGRTIFAELGESQTADKFVVLDYDGEYTSHDNFAVVAGSPIGEQAGLDLLHDYDCSLGPEAAVAMSLRAWGGARVAQEDPETPNPDATEGARRARQELEHGSVEVGWLDRTTTRETRFSLWPDARIQEALKLLA